ncbi:MAG: response regulator, partial [Acidobacteriota bacterium]|nr:response regulator [Acidobacteriota bacterium]
RVALDWVSTYDAARLAIGREAHDVYLLDHRLDTGSGLDLARAVQACRPTSPVIMLTSADDEQVALQAMRAGASDYLIKDEMTAALLERTIRYAQERQQIVTALRESEARTQFALEAGGVGVWERDLASGRIHWSAALSRILGLANAPTTLAYDEMLEVFEPEERERARRVAQQGQRDPEGFHGEFRIVRRDGSRGWIYIRGRPLGDAFGQPARLSGIAVDISERKTVEEELRRSQEQTRFAMRAARVGVWEWEIATGRVQWSESMEVVFGVPPDAFPTTRDGFLSYVHPDDRDGVKADIDRTVSSGDGHYRVSYRTIWPDGSVHWIESRAMVAESAPGRLRLLGVSVDITEQKTLEERVGQAQKMQAVGELAGGVAHDFNNLLTAILGFCDLLLDTPDLSADVRGDLAEIREAGRRASTLTNQLLAFSRRQVVQPRVVSLNDAVKASDKLLRRLIGEHISLSTVLSPEPEFVLIDPGQLDQIVLNLAINARDAMRDGGTLTLRTEGLELTKTEARRMSIVTSVVMAPGAYVSLAVNDTGCGMDAATRARVFEPFFTTKERGHGTGLGLATVYGIVKQADGYIGVESEPGRGSTFTIYLPRVSASGVEAVSDARPRCASLVRANSTVLLVEDDDGLRRFLKRSLTRAGFTVWDAKNGREGVELVRETKSRIDLVLTDVVMPQMNGRIMANAIRDICPGIPMLFTSGYTDEALGHHGVLAPDVPFIRKPFVMHELIRRIDELLASHDPASPLSQVTNG